MKLALVSAVALPALVSAHAPLEAHHARQQAAAAAASSSAAPVSSAAGATTAPAATSAVSLTFTLASTNPSAVPLSQIVSGASSQPTVAATTTFATGSTPSAISGAPGLPNGQSVPSISPSDIC